MKRKFTATAPNGQEFTRTSESKVYAFTVAVKRSYELDLARAQRIEPTDAANWRYYRKIAEGNDPHPYTDSDELQEKRIASARAEIAGSDTAEAYQARKAAERVAMVEQRKAQGYYEQFDNAGWCSRRDLADKLAGQFPGRALVLEVL